MKNKFFTSRIFVFVGFAGNFASETAKNIDKEEVFASQRLGN